MNVIQNGTTTCDYLSTISNQNNIKLEAEIQVVCRLCLKKANIDAYVLLSGPIKCMLELVLPELRLYISEFPMVCNLCLDMLHLSHNFKKSCLNTEKKIWKVSVIDKTTGLLDLNQLFYGNMIICSSEQQLVCRTCISVGKESSYTKLGRYKEDPVQNLMEKCLPEMAIDIIKEPAICLRCLEQLEEYFHFMMQCLTTEEKISYYCEVKNVCSKIDLNSVHNFSVSLEQNDDSCNIIPQTEVVIKSESDLDVRTISKNVNSPKILNGNVGNNRTKEVVTFQIAKGNNGDEIISTVSQAEEPDDYTDATTPMSDVLNVSHTEDFDVDETNALQASTILDEKEIDLSDCSEKESDSDDGHTDPEYTISGTQLKCSKCSFKTFSLQGMKIHKTVKHLRTKPKKTDLPDKKPRIRKTGPKKDCPICGLSITGHFLRRHIATHSNSDITNRLTHAKSKTFSLNGQLLKMYKCQLCPYQTRMAKNMRKHAQIHTKNTEIKLHKCKICDFETIQKENFTTHMQGHHLEDAGVKKCFLCSFLPKDEESLKQHVESFHKSKSVLL